MRDRVRVRARAAKKCTARAVAFAAHSPIPTPSSCLASPRALALSPPAFAASPPLARSRRRLTASSPPPPHPASPNAHPPTPQQTQKNNTVKGAAAPSSKWYGPDRPKYLGEQRALRLQGACERDAALALRPPPCARSARARAAHAAPRSRMPVHWSPRAPLRRRISRPRALLGLSRPPRFYRARSQHTTHTLTR